MVNLEGGHWYVVGCDIKKKKMRTIDRLRSSMVINSMLESSTIEGDML